MRNKFLAAVAATALVSIVNAAPASATAYPVGSPNFTATPGPNGTFSGALRVSGIAAGTFTDTFTFTLPTNGIGSGSVTTSATGFGNATDLDFTSVTINGTAASLMFTDPTRLGESAFAFNVPITGGILNTLSVSYVSRGAGSYGGNLSFTPLTAAVPETATWLMMLAGFAMIGAGVRYRNRSTTLTFA